MECPFCTAQPVCYYALECEVLTAALDEAEELRVALNVDIDSLKLRIQQLERYILDVGLNFPQEP